MTCTLLVSKKLDVCTDTSWTFEKLLLNCACTKFYRCNATPVVTSRNGQIYTRDELSV